MTDDQERLFHDNLSRCIEFHQLNQNDPYNVDRAVIVSLHAVKYALEAALRNEALPTPTCSAETLPNTADSAIRPSAEQAS